MYPVGSNGASQAILDARCLADALASCDHARQALAAYEADRLPKTAEIVRNNRKGGPEGVIDEVERLAPDGFDRIDDVLSHAQREAIVKGYAQLAGFAKDQVNRAAALAARVGPRLRGDDGLGLRSLARCGAAQLVAWLRQACRGLAGRL
jgi:2-polyprenyl-6-methoxyphenol hydroxylase-like FAD-dependent oxidoreductase